MHLIINEIYFVNHGKSWKKSWNCVLNFCGNHDRVFVVSMRKAWVLSYLLSAHTDLSFHWAYTHFVGFVIS